MPGRTLRLFAATAAMMFIGISAAAAGWYGGGGCCAPPPPPVHWGCGSSCAPLMPSFFHGGHNCCAPVRWGCGNPCGPAYAPAPIHVVQHGPVYQPPLTGYTYPAYTYEEEGGYPYMPGYFGYRPRPYGFGGYRHGGHRGYMVRRSAHWQPPYYGVRRHGPRHYAPHHMYRDYPLRVRGQARPHDMSR